MCAADLFRVYSSAMVPLMDAGGVKRPGDSLLAQLLLKASSNDKLFVIEEVRLALLVVHLKEPHHWHPHSFM